MLLSKYIQKIFKILVEYNIDHRIKSIRTYTKDTKEFIIFTQTTLYDVLKVIEEYNYNQCIEQQQDAIQKEELNKKRKERDLQQQQAEQLIKEQQQQAEQAKFDINQDIRTNIKIDYANFINSDNIDGILTTTDRVNDFNNLLPVIRDLEGVVDKAVIKRIVGKVKIPSIIKTFIPRLLNERGLINFNKIPKK
jgi:uncharacterized protein YqgV (UPF0045/DUF77 family)